MGSLVAVLLAFNERAEFIEISASGRRGIGVIEPRVIHGIRRQGAERGSDGKLEIDRHPACAVNMFVIRRCGARNRAVSVQEHAAFRRGRAVAGDRRNVTTGIPRVAAGRRGERSIWIFRKIEAKRMLQVRQIGGTARITRLLQELGRVQNQNDHHGKDCDDSDDDQDLNERKPAHAFIISEP